LDLVSFSKKYSFIRDIENREIDALNKEREKEELHDGDKSKISHAINIMVLASTSLASFLTFRKRSMTRRRDL
jgi:hypothetical protein